jgi:hypothetical protein
VYGPLGRTDSRANLLSVLFTGGPDAKLGAWRDHVGDLPGRLRS